jgi:cell division protein FtsB
MRVRSVLLSGVAIALSLAVGACGGNDNSVSPREAQQQSEQAAQNARQQARIQQLEKEVKEQNQGATTSSSGSSSAPAPTPVTQEDLSQTRDCGGVLAGPNTSCAFARNVANDYYSSGSSSNFSTYSPVTGQTYQMTCGGGSPVVCTGGNNATVYFP